MHKPGKSRGGRPTKKTPDREPLILKAIAKGVPYKAACQCADLSLFTFNEWRKNDSAFAEKVRRADLEAISRNVDLIQHAAEKGDWRAAAWLLERRCPESFSKPEIQLNQQIAVKSDNDIWSRTSASPYSLPKIGLSDAEKQIRMLEDSGTGCTDKIKDICNLDLWAR